MRNESKIRIAIPLKPEAQAKETPFVLLTLPREAIISRSEMITLTRRASFEVALFSFVSPKGINNEAQGALYVFSVRIQRGR